MPGNEPVQSLIRGLDILLFITQSQDGQRLNDLSDKMGLSPSTVHNLVKSLRLKGFVEKCPDGRLRTGSIFKELVKKTSVSGFHDKVENEMMKISGQLKDAIVTYSESVNSEISVVMRMSPDMLGILQHPTASRFHLYYNVSALVHLAFGDQEAVSWLKLSHPFMEEGLEYWKEEKQLDEYLQKARTRGYARSPFTEKEVLRLAVPVFSNTGLLRGGLGISIKLKPDDNTELLEKKYSEILVESSSKIKED